ncbi:hypothetical protein PM10SUCC1_33850 [Propionigenium maris DSM 9537]|uniref:Uncharacterized protein n=1 Tax=Propionigenium maris DSM 9537 TaxID=1123000 RepID=A0A9W6LNZ0_9FUSO|nr:hypothetical protein [Propionigenium maris]GLI57871.1 hypothetical protein PM10SUCC1_33850 [Propionigenium maris DSM 9537]
MKEITRLTYEKGLMEMSRGESILQALAIIAMIGFIIWNIKLIMEPLAEIEVSEDKVEKIKGKKELKVSSAEI